MSGPSSLHFPCLSFGPESASQSLLSAPPLSHLLPCSLIAGLRAATPSHAYALCLDDDVQLQPQLLASLAADMEADPTLFMATGGRVVSFLPLLQELFLGCMVAASMELSALLLSIDSSVCRLRVHA